MKNTKSVAMLMMVMMVTIGMQKVQANRLLCEFSGTCDHGRHLEPSPSPYQDHSSLDSDPSSESPSPAQDHSSFESDPSSESPSPAQDHSSFESDPSSESPSPSLDHSSFEFDPSSESPSPAQDHSSFESDPSSESPALSDYNSDISFDIPPNSDFSFDLSPNSISPSPMSSGKIFFCMYGCSIHQCINLGKDPKDIDQFDSCVAKCSETCMKKNESEDIYV